MPDQQISIPHGHVVMTTHGFVRQESVQCWSELRSYTERAGLQNIKWYMMPGALPEKTRNEAVRAMLREGAGWLLQVDADMTFPADALIQAAPDQRPGLLQVSYGLMPHIDAIGALCPLRGELALGTVDSGTGTWEAGWYPGSGIVEVMRTGAAFILVKRHVFEGLKDPWFRMRVPMRAIDALAEVDNFARIKCDGQNPLRDGSDWWQKLEKCAIDDPGIVPENFVPIEVGEDSGFCDRARNAGYRIFVDTDIPCGHVDTRILDWTQHKRSMDEAMKWQRLASGLLT